MNNKNILNKNTENFTSTKLDWSIIQAEMRNKLGNEVYESWLKKISFVEELKNYVLLSVSTRFIRDWITSRYLDQILQIIKIYKKDINRVELKINEKKDENINQISQGEISSLNENGNVAFIKDTYLQYNRIDPNKKFDNFIIGSSNKLAFEASNKVTEKISHYNPLYIYGGGSDGEYCVIKNVTIAGNEGMFGIFYGGQDDTLDLVIYNSAIWGNNDYEIVYGGGFSTCVFICWMILCLSIYLV